jgi:hypothetical protein
MIALVMKRKAAFLLFLLGLLVLIIGAYKLLRGRSAREGELRVETSPIVSVFLDNTHLGRAPIREKVASGEHTLKLVSESPTDQVAAWQGNVIVGPNLLTYVTAALSASELSSAVDILWLEKISGGRTELSVISNPDGATVLLNNETKGVTPVSLPDVAEGEYSLSVTSPGFLTRTMKIKVSPGYKLIASFKMALAAGAPVASPTATPSGTPAPTGSATGSATFADPPKPFVVVKDTPTGFLRVRTEPSTSATEAARVNPGEKYTYFDSENGWYQIKYDGTNSGWVSGQYVDTVE